MAENINIFTPVETLQSIAFEGFSLIIDTTNRRQERIFKQEYGESQNFMTPELIGYGVINPLKNIVYEVSRGTDFNHEVIYGVTVTDGQKRFYDDNIVFYHFGNAMQHICDLIEKYGRIEE